MFQTTYNDTYLFTDIFPDFATFKAQYEKQPVSMQVINKPANLEILYNLLYGKYGNSHFNSYNRGMIVTKLFNIVYIKAPLWEKKLEIQEELLKIELSNPEIRLGTKAIYNQAYNDGGKPSTNTLTEIETINNQSTTNYVKNKYDSLVDLYASLRVEVTTTFINEFDKLFTKCFMPLTYKVY